MVALIGRGNVASHLYKALEGKTEVALVNPHTLEDLPAEADIILICVSDSAIKSVIERLPESDALVSHTAGSIPMEIFSEKFKNYGVFYPLQTFTKGIELDYKKIPVFIEGSSPEVSLKLKKLAASFSEDVREADSGKRKSLHLASVFACNFTNALAGIAEYILREADLDFSAIRPLMRQTLDKLENISPKMAQTGPAARGDFNVIDAHMKMLENHPELQEIYSNLSDYIIRDHKSPNHKSI